MVALLPKKKEDTGSSHEGTLPVLDYQPSAAITGLRSQHAQYMLAIANERCRESFSELFAFYAPRVKSFMLRLGSDDAEAEELAQEVMVTVWRKAGLYDASQASVSTWIFRVARNRRIDAQRRKNRPDLSPDDPMLQPAGVEEPDITINRAQIEAVVRAGLRKLPADQLSLIQAAFYDGLSHSEIAKAFKLPLGTVKSRIRLAFQRLRGELGEAG